MKSWMHTFRSTTIEGVGDRITNWAGRNMPDPFVFALILTFLSFSLCLIFTPHGVLEILGSWKNGFWVFLKFSMQMCLILVTGYALASTHLVRTLIGKIANLPQSTASAASLICLVAIFTGLLNWGLGLIVGALTAREVALRASQRGVLMHYPILGAAGYMGLAVWHGGLSASAPLSLAATGHALENIVGTISIQQTLLSPLNLSVTCVLILGLPILFRVLSPSSKQSLITVDEILGCGNLNYPVSTKELSSPGGTSLASKLEDSHLISFLIASFGIGMVILEYVKADSLELNLDQVNFIFLFLGILLHKTPIQYVRAISEAISACSGIVLQFPFYAGIMGMVKGTGLITLIVQGVQTFATPATFGIFTFFSACVINLFVPSGGGQWMIQGPIVIQSAKEMGIPIETAVMAFCYGDQWTNLFQPFWALPLLGITGLRVNHVMGYCILIMFVGFLFFPAILYLFS